ncbi:hypothetical protein GPALN_005096 [Globodera pallida]|nr:hypothetical protein GPALN_005096 [Globodera pallida]
MKKFTQFNFVFGVPEFVPLFIILLSTICCVDGLFERERNKKSENSASLSSDNSAQLARVRQLRQSRDASTPRREESGGTKTTNAKTNGKAKRYKCFLVDDDDSEEKLAQQNSYFAGFQQRNFVRKHPADILGWEEGPRRSEGVGPRYLYASTKGTTAEPIIEYIEDDDNVNEAGVGTTMAFEDTVASLAQQRTTMQVMAPKQHLNKFSMQTTTATTPHSKASDESQQGEDYVDEFGDDLYISTTRKPIQQQLQTMATTLKAQFKMPRARSIPGAAFDGGTNKIGDEKTEDKMGQFVPDVKIKATMRPFNVPIAPLPQTEPEKSEEILEEENKMAAERLSKEMQQQAQLIRITPLRKSAEQTKTESEKMKPKQLQNFEPVPQQNVQQQQPDNDEEQMTAPPAAAATVPRDSQGRPLILSPEHCKMVEHYSSLYGMKDVRSFVHNNCGFAKMYLPTATCAEIDILIASCYPQRNDQRKRKRRH